jgi:hypothetical protein
VERHTLGLAAASALALFGAVGCSLADNTTSGELNQGGFSYEPVGDGRSDVATRTLNGNLLTSNNPVPLLAQGGTFKVRFIPNGGGSEWGSDQIIPAAPGLVVRDGANLVAKRPGQSAILANDGSVVQDFVHVHVKLIDHIEIARTDAGFDTIVNDNEAVLLIAGQPTVNVVAQPKSAVGEVLGGALSYAWSVEGDADVVALTSNLGFANGLAAGTKPGTATVKVKVAGLSASFQVQVK